MTRKPLDQLGNLQRAVLEAVWELRGGTVNEIIERLEPQRKPAYTTILTTLQNLTKAGWIKPEKSGRAFIYHATRSKSQADAKSISAFISRAFSGNTKVMLQTLLEEENLSDDELMEIRRMIDRKRKENQQNEPSARPAANKKSNSRKGKSK